MSKENSTKIYDQSVSKNPLLDFVELTVNQVIDEAAIIAEAKAQLVAQAEEERAMKIWELVRDEDLFDEKGKFAKLPKEQLLSLLSASLDELERQTNAAIERRGGEIDWGDANVTFRLAHMLKAAERGIILPDWKERIRNVDRATHYYPDRYSQSVIEGIRNDIQAAATKIDELSGEVPKGVTGKGLEFSPSAVGSGQKVYLNGKLVASLSGGQLFGDTPTNGEVVAWLTVNQIDYCNIKGRQMRWSVYAWKQGMMEPCEVYEDHAYDREGYLQLDPPRVAEDGTIIISRSMDGIVTEKRKKL